MIAKVVRQVRPAWPAARDWHALSSQATLDLLDVPETGLTCAEAAARLERAGRNLLPTTPPPGVLEIGLAPTQESADLCPAGRRGRCAALGDFGDAGFIGVVLRSTRASAAGRSGEPSGRARVCSSCCGFARPCCATASRWISTPRRSCRATWSRSRAASASPADLRLLDAHGLEIDEALLTGESLAVLKDAAWIGARRRRSGRLPQHGVCRARPSPRVAGMAWSWRRARPRVVGPARDLDHGRRRRQAAAGRADGAVQSRDRARRAVGRDVHRRGRCPGARRERRDDVHVRRRACRLGHSRGPARRDHDRTRHRGATHGRPRRHRAPAPGGRGPRQLHAHRERQDRHAHLQRADRARGIPAPMERAAPSPARATSRTGQIRADDRRADGRWQRRPARLLEVAAACNEGDLHPTDGAWVWRGDPTDIALLALAGKGGVDRETLLVQRPAVNGIPFEPEHRFAATFHARWRTAPGSQSRARRNGSSRCATWTPGSARPCSRQPSTWRAVGSACWRWHQDRLSRVMDSGRDAGGPRDLQFAGLVGLIDPLRPEVPAAVRRCDDAGHPRDHGDRRPSGHGARDRARTRHRRRVPTTWCTAPTCAPATTA